MRRAFSLIELLIGIFILALALAAISVVFARISKEVVDNQSEIISSVETKNFSIVYGINTSDNLGWNISYLEKRRDIHFWRLSYWPYSGSPIKFFIGTDLNSEASIAFENGKFSDLNVETGDAIFTCYGRYLIYDPTKHINEFELDTPIFLVRKSAGTIYGVYRTK